MHYHFLHHAGGTEQSAPGLAGWLAIISSSFDWVCCSGCWVLWHRRRGCWEVGSVARSVGHGVWGDRKTTRSSMQCWGRPHSEEGNRRAEQWWWAHCPLGLSCSCPLVFAHTCLYLYRSLLSLCCSSSDFRLWWPCRSFFSSLLQTMVWVILSSPFYYTRSESDVSMLQRIGSPLLPLWVFHTLRLSSC